MKKPFIAANVKEFLNLYDKEEISFQKFVEMLNTLAFDYMDNHYRIDMISAKLEVTNPVFDNLGIEINDDQKTDCLINIKNIELLRPALTVDGEKEEGTICHGVSGERYIIDLPFKSFIPR